MDTCFLFTKHLTLDGCLSLKRSDQGALIAPLAQRPFSEIKELQKESKTLIIETSSSASFFDLELPWLSESKARAAIPYALEEKVAQPIESLHFAYDKQRYHNNSYLIAVIAKNRLQYLIDVLDEHAIEFDTITLDFFALTRDEAFINENVLIVHQDEFKGALKGELAQNYLKSTPKLPILAFKDSTFKKNQAFTPIEEASYVWLAERLHHTTPLNLCQGDMRRGTNLDWIKKGYVLAAGIFALWLLSLIMVNFIALYSLNQKTKHIDEDIAVIYKDFFPEAKQVISPRFRISQLIGSKASGDHTQFWYLLNQFSKVMGESNINTQQLRYQNKILTVTLTCPDFASLEGLERQLKNLQLTVKQTHASTHEQHVVATLELM